MEGLPYDFASEEDDEDIDKKKPSRRSISAAELLKDIPKDQELEKSDEEKPVLTREFEPNVLEEVGDNAPELDGEAPLEHLSRPEAEAIAQVMASDRLQEIGVEEEEVSSESLAAESFLENVEATGDIDQAYSETMQELGEAAISSSPKDIEIETETAPPIDPQILVEEAKNEIRPAALQLSTPRVESAETTRPSKPKTEQSPKTKLTEARPAKVYDSIVDYVTGRRHGRMSDKSQHEVVERKLSEEVSQLQRELSSHESYVRQMARNRSFEKPPKPKAPPKAEVQKSRELAGISAHTMDLGELTKVAAEIPAGESTLKTIYENHLIGEKGLRRVVAEYLRGENHEKTLTRELIEREKDFERDPFLRDQASTTPITSQPLNLDRLLKNTGIDFNEPQPMIERPKVKPASLPDLIEELRSPSKQVRKIFDITMISAIMLMAAVIILLIIYR